jgi:hypothetical protein
MHPFEQQLCTGIAGAGGICGPAAPKKLHFTGVMMLHGNIR